jgi:hypothetical protein
MSGLEKEINDLMEPGEGLESTTKVSLTGEEIPSDLEPETDPDISQIIEDEPAPKTDEPAEEQAPEGTGEPELSDHEKKFFELGLDKQFKGGLDEVLQRIPNMNKYISDLELRNKTLLENQATPPAEPAKPELPSAEEFYEKPIESIQKMLNAKVNEQLSGINEKLIQYEAKNFENSVPDYKQMEPLMMDQLNLNPGLKQLGTDAFPILYKMAKAQQLSDTAPAPTTPEVKVIDKASAETSAGKKVTPVDKTDPAYWQGKSRAEIAKELGVTDNRYLD